MILVYFEKSFHTPLPLQGTPSTERGSLFLHYTVSMKFRSTRLKIMTAKKRVTSMKMVL